MKSTDRRVPAITGLPTKMSGFETMWGRQSKLSTSCRKRSRPTRRSPSEIRLWRQGASQRAATQTVVALAHSQEASGR